MADVFCYIKVDRSNVETMSRNFHAIWLVLANLLVTTGNMASSCDVYESDIAEHNTLPSDHTSDGHVHVCHCSCHTNVLFTAIVSSTLMPTATMIPYQWLQKSTAQPNEWLGRLFRPPIAHS